MMPSFLADEPQAPATKEEKTSNLLAQAMSMAPPFVLDEALESPCCQSALCQSLSADSDEPEFEDKNTQTFYGTLGFSMFEIANMPNISDDFNNTTEVLRGYSTEMAREDVEDK